VTSSLKIQKLLQEAVAHHQAGRLAAAEALYAKVIKADPRNVDALHLMGVAAHSRNQIATARKYFNRALEYGPKIPEIHLNFGNLLGAADDLQGAQAAYARAVALKPGLFDAHLGLGGVFYKMGRFEEAAGCFRTAVGLAPQNPRGHFNLGQSLLRLSTPDQAQVSLRRALELQSDYLEAHVALGGLYADAERFQDAIHHARRATELNPVPEQHSNLGELFRRAGDLDASFAAHRAAVDVRPDDPIILHNYAAALHAAERFDEAEKVARRALAHDPNFVEGHVALAKIFECQGRYEQTIAALKQALAIDPAAPGIRFKLALRHLMAGVFPEGWADYENRFLTPDRRQVRRPSPPPYWTGEDLTGRTILIWTEQGLGDEILYASMIPDVLARAKRCVIECSPRMAPVFARAFPQASVMAYQNQIVQGVPPEIDFQIPVASLGQFLRRDFASFPHRAGYLKADPAHAAVLRARYQAIAPGNLVVGISWRSRNQDIAVVKSTDLSAWADILRVPGITFVNLQYGDCAEELAGVNRQFGTQVFHDNEINSLESMDAFFAQVAALDLVISTSNTTVHVAGSLGIPTWLLLSRRPGGLWYWFHERSDSPWYQSVKILRQHQQSIVLEGKTWGSGVVAAAADDLASVRLNPSGLRV
jgi:tetratricopeptide (TPR) repeat protein